jgi:hypothetical protein
MNGLVRLPNGDWISPARVSSIEAIACEDTRLTPCVVVRTMDGARIVLLTNDADDFELTQAVKLRDEIARQIREALLTPIEKAMRTIGTEVPF